MNASLPTPFWYLAGGMLVNRLGTFVLPYLAIYLTTARGFGVGAAGAVLSCYGAGAIVSSLGGGVLADRWGRLPTMVSGLVVAGGLTVLLAAVTTPLAIAVTAAALGVASELYRPAANATVADLVPEPDRVRAYGVLYWAGNLGFSASAILGGLIASHSFTALFLIDAVTSAACGALLWAGLREMRYRYGVGPAPGARSAPGPATPGLAAAFRDSVFLWFVALCLVFMAVYFQGTVALPVTVTQAGISPAGYGVIIAANGVTVIALQPPLTRLLRRVSLGGAMALAALLLGAGLGMLAWVHAYLLFIVAAVVWTVGEIGYSVAGPALVSRLAPADLRGRYQGVFGVAGGVAAFVGPASCGAALATLGTRWLWLICLGLGVGIAAGHLALRGGYQRDSRAAVPELARSIMRVGAE